MQARIARSRCLPLDDDRKRVTNPSSTATPSSGPGGTVARDPAPPRPRGGADRRRALGQIAGPQRGRRHRRTASPGWSGSAGSPTSTASPAPHPATTRESSSWTPRCTSCWRRWPGSWVAPGDAGLARRFDELVSRVGAAQDPDGYLNTSFGHEGQRARYSDLEWGHELYCAGHLIQAATARLRTGHDDALPAIARRVADHLWEAFGPDGRDAVCGHPEIEVALVEFARATGDPRHLELARILIERRGRRRLATTLFQGSDYFLDDVPVREAEVLRGHAVRALYLAAAALDVAAETAGRRARGCRARPVRPYGRPSQLPDRGHGRTPPERGVRRRLRAARGPRLRRDLRLHRVRDGGLEAAAAHRRHGVRRPDRAHPAQRRARRTARRRAGLLLLEHPASPRAHDRGGRRRAVGAR